MFTGIVQGVAFVLKMEGSPELKKLTLKFPKKSLQGLQTGASISINGTCLTVTEFNFDESIACFDVIEETLRTTNLGFLTKESKVNFERASKIGDEIGGHLMSGHIHTSVKVKGITRSNGNCTINFAIPPEYQDYIVEKGFIGLNGCSLTLGKYTHSEFCVHLIPETLSITTFGQLEKGDLVNIELDHQTKLVVDTVERILLQKGFTRGLK